MICLRADGYPQLRHATARTFALPPSECSRHLSRQAQRTCAASASNSAKAQTKNPMSPINSIFVSRSGVSTCTEFCPRRHNAQFFPMYNRTATKNPAHNRAGPLKINGLRVSSARFSQRSRAQRFTTSRRHPSAPVRHTHLAAVTPRQISSSGFCDLPKVAAFSLTSCADQISIGGNAINSRKSISRRVKLMTSRSMKPQHSLSLVCSA